MGKKKKGFGGSTCVLGGLHQIQDCQNPDRRGFSLVGDNDALPKKSKKLSPGHLCHCDVCSTPTDAISN